MRTSKALPGPKWFHLGLAVLILDQATKTLARWLLPLCDAPDCAYVAEVGPIGFVRVDNAGSAFGFAQGFDVWTFVATAGLVAMPLIAMGATDLRMPVGAALLIGGGLGNLIDRVLLGAVTDFADVGLPIVFNLADIALAVGCVLMMDARRRAMRSSDA